MEPIMRAEPQIIPLQLSRTKLVEKQAFEPLYGNSSPRGHQISKAQFQASESIYQETARSHLLISEASSLASSASCNSLTPFSSPWPHPRETSHVQIAVSSSSPWNDYILCDPFTTIHTAKELGCGFQVNASDKHLIPEERNMHLQNITSGNANISDEVMEVNESIFQADPSLESTSSTVDSFVETILARHKEMMKLEFPNLLDGYYDY